MTLQIYQIVDIQEANSNNQRSKMQILLNLKVDRVDKLIYKTTNISYKNEQTHSNCFIASLIELKIKVSYLSQFNPYINDSTPDNFH